MFWEKRLQKAMDRAYPIEFDDSSKFILFSDVHRGVNDWSDDFAQNQLLFFHALTHYLSENYTYIELGDGDELWENKYFRDIREAHSHIFWLLSKFYQQKRFHLIYGNHDIERQWERKVRKTLFTFRDEKEKKVNELFKDIKVYESILLRHKRSEKTILLLHGHQADCVSGILWRFSRCMVRHFWKHLQLLGFNDPTSPAKNYRRANKVERHLMQWVTDKKQFLIAGHTHRSRIPMNPAVPFFNTGSCVHPRCITGLEIADGQISLIKWWVRMSDDPQCDCLQVKKDLILSPQKLEFYWK